MGVRLASLCGSAVFLWASLAYAEGPVFGEPVTPEEPAIANGANAEACAFPPVVAWPGCSSTLIHPRVVLSAAHCGGANAIRFGESSGGGSGQTVGVDYCRTNPDYSGNSDQGDDWAYCVLSQPVYDVPVIPPAVGCEADFEIGQTVVMVGYGDASENGGFGTKRYAQTEVTNVMDDMGTIFVGPMAPNACPGDSGGPLLIRFPDDSWRTVGIASTLSGDCGSEGAFNAYAMVRDAVPWIEETSGIDVTPCHDADGTWNPGPECGGFWTGLNEGFGSWSNWCSGTPAGGASTTCGPGHGEQPETTAPVVTITAPANGSEFMSDPGSGAAFIDITADANDGSGWGITSTELLVDGAVIASDNHPPYEWGANFPAGSYELQVRAFDGWNNEGLSNVVTIYVDQDAPESTTGNTSDSSDPTGDGEVGTGEEGDPGQDGEGGCACDLDGRGSGGGSAALLLLLGALRRRQGRGLSLGG